jgi:hypothetical protein
MWLCHICADVFQKLDLCELSEAKSLEYIVAIGA